jgi:Lipocalin-like domain
MRKLLAVAILLTSAVSSPVGFADETSPSFLKGTWNLKQAYEIKPDGSFAYPYGQTPEGILIVDAHGRYVVEIYGENRVKFPANAATLDEYKQAMTTMSVHTGQVEVDATGGLLIFHVGHNGYAERDGTTQKRPYELKGNVLSYRIPAAAEGKINIPVTVWERAKD